jgi:hypothetical protein
MAARIVTSTYRYKRPPRKKRKAAPLEGPVIVRKGAAKPETTPAPANDDRKPAIVTVSDNKRVAARPTTVAVGSDATPSGIDTPRPQTAAAPPRSAIVTAKRPRSRFGDAPDLTPEEHSRRGEAAAELWREMMRRAASKD